MSRRLHLAVSAAATAALIGAMTSPPAYADPNNNTVRKLTKAVTVDGVVDHLEAFQDIADEYGDRGIRTHRPGVQVPLLRGQLGADQGLAEPSHLRQRHRLPSQHLRLREP
jgi:hypothetical protein